MALIGWRSVWRVGAWGLGNFWSVDGDRLGKLVVETSDQGGWRRVVTARYLVIAFTYVVAICVLDRISYIHPFRSLDITPWDPSSGLTLALLVRCGMSFAPVAPLAGILSTLLRGDSGTAWLPALISVGVSSAGYIVAAWMMRRVMRIDPGLSRLPDVVRFIAVSLIAALVVGLLVIANYLGFGLLDRADSAAALFRSWIGDTIGILTLGPAFLVFTDPELALRLPGRGQPLAGRFFESLIQIGVTFAAVWLVVDVGLREDVKFFYVLFLPIVWVAVRQGLPGATLAIVMIQVGLVLAVQSQGLHVSTLLVVQTLMVALDLTGLLLGAVVSAWRLANRALRESEARLIAILNTAPAGIMTCDFGGDIESANPAGEDMFGWPAGALAGCSIIALLPALKLGLEGITQEIQGVRRDGSIFPIDVSVGKTLIAQRQMFIVIVRDVTRRAEAEALVRQHRIELAHADRVSLIGEMASAIGHEISQPLAAIAAYARACRFLLDSPEPDRTTKVRQSLDKLAAQAARAGEVMTRQREFLHRGEITVEPVAVAELAYEVGELARTDLAEHGIRLAIEVAPNLPRVNADRIHIQQVMLNLVRNAVDAITDSQVGEPVIKIAARQCGERIELEVRDSGPGIDPAIADRLFQPFATTKGTGMGLGLSISRTIVEAHGGQLRLQAFDSGPGTAFRFDLPVSHEPKS
ncbi:two-component system, LuxR family, sensor kinase FixL [uncultured Gammaproteobacteria bacterium]